MLDWIVALCIETIGIPCASYSPIAILFLLTDEIRNSAMICSAIVSSCMLRDARGIRVDSGIPLFWCL